MIAIGCIPLVLLRKKDPPSAIAWILALLFLPLVGVVLFWFLGRDRVRRPARRKAETNALVRDRLPDLSDDWLDAELDASLAKHPQEERGLMRLAARLGNMSVMSHNKVDVLVGALDTYAAQIEAIDSATDHVHLEYYIFQADDQGQRFVEALCRAAKRGVRVRLLYDAFGSRKLTRRFLRPLREVGGRAKPFFPFNLIRGAWTINLRNHRKLMVIDGQTGFVGGINIGRKFLDWHDIHLRIEGPAAKELQTVFAEDWFFATREHLEISVFAQNKPSGETLVQILQSGPDETLGNIHHLYFAAIASARKRVQIVTPYFVPDKALLAALQTAALRGIDVQLLLPYRSNHKITFHAGRSYYDELLGAGVRIYEYQQNMIHAKVMIVDDAFATIGSANLDTRSFRLNFELIAVLHSHDVASKIGRMFMRDLGQSEWVERDRWQRRSVPARLMEGFGRLCSPLL